MAACTAHHASISAAASADNSHDAVLAQWALPLLCSRVYGTPAVAVAVRDRVASLLESKGGLVQLGSHHLVTLALCLCGFCFAPTKPELATAALMRSLWRKCAAAMPLVQVSMLVSHWLATAAALAPLRIADAATGSTSPAAPAAAAGGSTTRAQWILLPRLVVEFAIWAACRLDALLASSGATDDHAITPIARAARAGLGAALRTSAVHALSVAVSQQSAECARRFLALCVTMELELDREVSAPALTKQFWHLLLPQLLQHTPLALLSSSVPRS